MAYINELHLEDVKVIFRNFSGKPDKYGSTRRTVGIVLTEQIANDISPDGWYIRELKPRNEEENPKPWLKCFINYRGEESLDPKIFIIPSGKRKKTLLTEATVGMLDCAEIVRVDVIVSPYRYVSPDGVEKVSAYIKKMYVTVVQDAFEDRYDFDDEEEELPFPLD